MPTVSIIMPAHNAQRYIARALESVLNQTYGDFEVIIIDDGSTDGTESIARAYEDTWPAKIRFIRQNNAGPGAARNTALRNLKGKYVAFLDADDSWLPSKLEKQVAVLDGDPTVDFVYCDNYYINEEGKIVVPLRLRPYVLPRERITLEFFFHYFMFTSTVVVRRSCLEKIGFFREDIFVGEDYDYFLRLSWIGRAELIDEKLLEKRCLKESLSNQDYMLNAKNDLLILTGFLAEHPEFYRDHKETIAKRLGDYHFTVGYYWLHHGKRLRSLYYMIGSLKYQVTMKTIKCIMLSLFPHSIIRYSRRKLLKGRYETIRV